MAKFIIDNEQLAIDFIADTMLVGISSGMPCHQLIWTINKNLFYDFKYENDLLIPIRYLKREYFFPVYSYKEKHFDLKHFIYSNLNDGAALLPEFKQFEYLWLLKGDFPKEQFVVLLINELKENEGIRMVATLQKDKIRNPLHIVL